MGPGTLVLGLEGVSLLVLRISWPGKFWDSLCLSLLIWTVGLVVSPVEVRRVWLGAPKREAAGGHPCRRREE